MGGNAASQVGKGSQVFGGVVFLLDRILLRIYSMDQSLNWAVSNVEFVRRHRFLREASRHPHAARGSAVCPVGMASIHH